jgi:hypothetical protein
MNTEICDVGNELSAWSHATALYAVVASSELLF